MHFFFISKNKGESLPLAPALRSYATPSPRGQPLKPRVYIEDEKKCSRGEPDFAPPSKRSRNYLQVQACLRQPCTSRLLCSTKPEPPLRIFFHNLYSRVLRVGRLSVDIRDQRGENIPILMEKKNVYFLYDPGFY